MINPIRYYDRLREAEMLSRLPQEVKELIWYGEVNWTVSDIYLDYTRGVPEDEIVHALKTLNNSEYFAYWQHHGYDLRPYLKP